MKVSEAEKLVCPFIQEQTIGTSYQQIFSNDCANINCITNKCMAWTFEKLPTHECHNSDEQKYYNSKEGYCMRLNNV
jgi:hypothetical protein